MNLKIENLHLAVGGFLRHMIVGGIGGGSQFLATMRLWYSGFTTTCRKREPSMR